MSTQPEQFPAIEPGGSLLLAWQVRNRHVLVVGGGNVAAGRIVNLLNADALVTVVCPTSGLIPEVAHRIATAGVTHIPRDFRPEDLDAQPWIMALTAVDDAKASSEIWRLCKQKRIPVNVADVPPECDFYFGSIHRDGPLQIMVSTNGNGPKLANIIRRQIADFLPANTGEAIRKVGALRKKLRKVAPAQAEGPKRMDWMTRVSEAWTPTQLCDMDEDDMALLLKHYVANVVLTYQDVKNAAGMEKCPRDVVWEFDGSFGWCV